jgi:hypothetical protein
LLTAERIVAATLFDALLLRSARRWRGRQIVERLDAGLAQRHQHRFGQMRQFGQRILDAQRRGVPRARLLAALQRFLRAVLQLGASSSSKPSIERARRARRRPLPRAR